MILVVGLGNPGKQYEKTRHNVGSRIVDELHSSPHFATARIIKELAKDKKEGVVLAQPHSFMNDSGQAVKKLMGFYKLKSENLWVIHDDADLPIGEIKIVKNRGSAGHKGVQSIIEELKTKDFNRIRIGIQPKTGKPKTLEKFVLQNFTKDEERLIKKAVEGTIQTINNINK
ncbi:MAG: aminoacyl-tRNA hydrolase [Candidatus Nealsonbacteria bacterium]|nr:aminoacyl-tRNA hydrolase [Candidatus Nealsonbacteria bacterium]